MVLAAVPLGNVGDASERLKFAIESADLVAAEDSRRFLRLCKDLNLNCRAQVISFFEGNESERLEEIADALRNDKRVLLVTDAGMPSVSDPGFRAARMAIDNNFKLTVIPGPSAVLAALALSGLPTDSFAFDGFPPRTSGARQEWFAQRANETRTLVLFEAPHRISETIAAIKDEFGGNRQMAICREITKTYEETVRGTAQELFEWSTSKEMLGEFTIVIAGYVPDATEKSDIEIAELVKHYEASGITRKEAISIVAKELHLPKRKVFDIMVLDK
ncbi:MAG: 16S rRNA (cytidine(1402)-2'-O)-methyltransferase [Actinobacteria bacterium]|nr:16S rRNA (cytidine(1402)-2'-O)-methyltransferase [Actinomycetota bacterium]